MHRMAVVIDDIHAPAEQEHRQRSHCAGYHQENGKKSRQ
jgi:hypothetical protein